MVIKKKKVMVATKGEAKGRGRLLKGRFKTTVGENVLPGQYVGTVYRWAA